MGDAHTGSTSVPPQTRCSAASWNHCARGKGTLCPALCGSALLLWIREVIFPETPESPLPTGQGLEFPTFLTQVFLLALFSPPLNSPDLTTHIREGNPYMFLASSFRSRCGWHLPGEWELGSGPETSLPGGQR